MATDEMKLTPLKAHILAKLPSVFSLIKLIYITIEAEAATGRLGGDC
jgi:hypothetical protein